MWMEELPNGKYKYFERYKDPYTEKLKRVSVTLTSKSNQAKKQAMMELQEKINVKISNQNEHKVTLANLYEEWIEIYKQKVKEQTYLTSVSLYKAVELRMDTSVLINNLTSSYIQKFLNDFYYKENYSHSYTDAIRSLFRNMFEYAKQVGFVEYNIIKDVKIERKKATIEEHEKVTQKYLEPDELELVIEELRNLKHSSNASQYAEIAEVLSKTGLRYGELAALKIEDYDGTTLDVNKTLFYNYSKAQDGLTTSPKNVFSNRKIPISNETKAIIDKWISQNELNKAINSKYNDMGFLLAAPNGDSVPPFSMNRVLRNLSTKLKEQGKLNKRLSTHIFRHTHISLLAEMGINQKAIMSRVGQVNPLTTLKIYTHVTKKVEQDLIDKLNAKEKEQG
ncbi:tyrosine-type recombinase/integrase [Enterococcus casseliflavus]|uniref:tyrosine-type recombinase/integrase n=1 Tax=Enterococcus casseliflavus TaxID=37734 RepID=UPI0039A60C03